MMPRPRVARRWLTVGVLLFVDALLPSPGQAQEPEVFDEAIEVRVVNFEVRVTDRQGRHVAGLGPRDFRLELDGEPMAIEYFSEIRDRTAQRGAEPAGVSTPGSLAPSVTPGERIANSYLVFVDNVFGIARDRRLVLEAMTETVDRLESGDRMVFVVFDGRRLRRIGDWESSPEVLAANLAEVMAVPTAGLSRLGELGTFDRERARQGAGFIADSDSFISDGYVFQLGERIERVLRAATSALRAFADAPGRKVMLLASGGWPRDPSTYAVGFNPQARSRAQYAFPKKAFDELIGSANQLGYTLYPIDVPGRRSGVQAISAENRGGHIPGITEGFGSDVLRQLGGSRIGRPPVLTTDLATAGAAFSGGPLFDPQADREFEVEATLLELARETGGRALINSQRRLALVEVLEDTSSYYWLGVTWTRRGESREARVRVEVPETRYDVRSRRGFREHSRSSEVAMQVESQLLFDAGQARAESGDGVLGVELGVPKLGRRVRQPAVLRVPLDHVVMVPGAQGFSAQLELHVAAIGEDGARSELPVIPVRLSGAEAPEPGQVAVVDVVLRLRNQKQKLVLALHDLGGGAALTATVWFEPPE